MLDLISDRSLISLYEKVAAGERLTFDDGVQLCQTPDLLTVGKMANIIRERKNGNRAYYNINQHIDYSNVCILHARCHFCAFARKDIQTEGAFELGIEQFMDKAQYALDHGCTEIHSVGGLHPKLSLEYYLELLRTLKREMPQVHLKFFTAVEVHHLARLAKLSVRETLIALKEAGLDSIPGGGAEVFDEGVREQICRGKLGAEGWLNVMRTAHELGIRSNATILYGHVEKPEHTIDHLIRLRELQDETGGFVTFIPLAFHPENTRMAHIPSTTGMVDLRNIAVARLMLDNFDHIKAYWIMIGIKLAQVSLSFGADDIDGTVTEELITHAAGAKTPEALTVNEIVRYIRETGRDPVERDTHYNEIVREGNRWRRKAA